MRNAFASRFALGLVALGVLVLAAGIAVGPVGAVLGVAMLALCVWQWRRMRRLRLVVDAPGADARLRHGRDGRETLPLADVAGGIVHRTAGTTYQGIRTGADVERWVIVGHDGRMLRHLDGRGFAPADLVEARERVGGSWMTVGDARVLGLLPADAPWELRHPRGALALALASIPVTIAVLVGIGLLLAQVGRPAFVWPWW